MHKLGKEQNLPRRARRTQVEGRCSLLGAFHKALGLGN